LLSFVVPVHRVEPYLAECLDSILSEAAPEIEVVAVDDHSPDRSGEIADGYARRDPRVRVVHLTTNVGLGPARNVGLAHATGEYVWFVDSDDRLPPGAVRAVLDRLTATRPDVLIVDHADAFDDGRVGPGLSGPVLAGLTRPVRLVERPQLLRLAQSACTKVVRRAFLNEIDLRFFPGWYEDSAFSHPLLLAAERIDGLDRVCYHYRQRGGGGITRTVSARHFEVFEQYQRLFEIVDKAAPRYDTFRPELFRLMIDHYLVIVGNQRRVPPKLRRAFFRRMAGDFRTRLPAAGYDLPGGVAGLKHRLVRRDAYLAYAMLRAGHRLLSRLLRPRGERARRPRPVLPSPARPPAARRAADRGPRSAGRTTAR
jgi:glycosyltransferase involved in cell wall biosynthesis